MKYCKDDDHKSKPSLCLQEEKNSVRLFRVDPVCIIITFSVRQSSIYVYIVIITIVIIMIITRSLASPSTFVPLPQCSISHQALTQEATMPANR